MATHWARKHASNFGCPVVAGALILCLYRDAPTAPAIPPDTQRQQATPHPCKHAHAMHEHSHRQYRRADEQTTNTQGHTNTQRSHNAHTHPHPRRHTCKHRHAQTRVNGSRETQQALQADHHTDLKAEHERHNAGCNKQGVNHGCQRRDCCRGRGEWRNKARSVGCGVWCRSFAFHDRFNNVEKTVNGACLQLQCLPATFDTPVICACVFAVMATKFIVEYW